MSVSSVQAHEEAVNVSESWQPPIPLGGPSAPAFPSALLPGWVGAFVDALAEATETPPELAAMMALATLATCAAKLFVIRPQPGRYFEPLNLWTVAALEPGNRKSAVLKACTEPLLNWESRMAEARSTEIVEAKAERQLIEGRIKNLEAQAHKAKPKDLQALREQIQAEREALPEIPTLPQLWTGDVTPEHLGALMAEQGERMAILVAEGGIFETIGGRYSNGVPNLDLFLQAHSGDSVRVDRGSREPVYMRQPALTLGLSPQPDVLRGLTDNPGFRGRGLIGRFLYALPVSRVGYRTLATNPVPEDVERAYHDGITAMLELAPKASDKESPQARELILSDAALLDWREFALAIEERMRPGGDLEFIKDWGGKLPGQALRIAGLFHVASYVYSHPETHEVGQESMDSALTLVAILIRHALAVFDLMGADPSLEAARHVWGWVERTKASTFSARDAFNALRGRFKSMKMIEPAFAVMIERFHIREVKNQESRRAGRPSRVFEVNPSMMGGW